MTDLRPWLLLALTLSGCQQSAPAHLQEQPASGAPTPGVASPRIAALEARVPEAPGPFAPAMSRLVGTFDAERYADDARCAECHPSQAEAHADTPHAYASFHNPYYRLSVDRFRAHAGLSTGRFCAGCHDVSLLFDGGMDAAVDAEDPRAHVGVTCVGCHRISEVRPDGNGSYTLDMRPAPIPAANDPQDPLVPAHRAAFAMAPLATVGLCTSCHRSFVGPATGHPHHFIGMDDAGAWSSSAWAGSLIDRVDVTVPERTCVDCHMPERPDGSHDHRVLASHGPIAAREGSAGVEWLRARLAGAVSLDVAAARMDGDLALPAERVRLRPGGRLELDLVVKNEGVGHRFPGGTTDLQDTWLEVEVRDAGGAILASSGVGWAEDDERIGEADAPHRLRSWVVDERGQDVARHDVHQFRTVLANHTIAPRDAAVVRYALTLPAGPLSEPLSVRARVRHRRHDAVHRGSVCDAPASAAFFEVAQGRDPAPLDPCAPQPVLDLAEARLELGQGRAPRASGTPMLWQRLANHGMGLLHDRQEHLEDARASLLRALAEVEGQPSADAERRAIVVSLLAALEGKQGRVDAALARLEALERLVPGHPSVSWLRGQALAAVWRWPLAAEAFAEAARKAPMDTRVWVRLAEARGSARQDRASLEAAWRGLSLRPRHAGLLLAQALALEALGAPAVEVERARAAYLGHRPDDDGMDHRLRCTGSSAQCDRERLPVHVHPLGPRPPRDPGS